MLLAQAENSIRARGLLRRGEHALIAVSGGLDSMVLLHVLHALSIKHNWKFTVAHFNHQIRGRAGDADAAFVQKTARALGLPAVIERGDVKKLAKTGGLSLEMAARKLRHEFLARAAKKRGIRTVVLAHHADDQVELFFLRLLRGAGGGGLAGMKWRSPSPACPDIQIIRPLLDVPKAGLEQFARENKIRWRHDSTNSSLDIRRNRVRHELLPLLKRHYQPATDRTVLRVMDIIGAEADFVTGIAVNWLKQKRRAPFSRLPIALQRRCLQLQLQQLDLPVDFDLIEELRKSAGAAVNLGPDISVGRGTSGLVQIRTHKPAAFDKNQVSVELAGPKQMAVFDGLACRWQITTTKGRALPPKRRDKVEYFDADKIGPKISLRHWRPGDRFHPIGMKIPVKLQDWFTNQKIARTMRHKLVLGTVANGEIFWVQDLRISDNFKLTPATKRRLKWQWSARI